MLIIIIAFHLYNLLLLLCNRYDFTCTNWNIHDDESDAVVDTKKIFPDLVLVRKVKNLMVFVSNILLTLFICS